MNVIENLGMGKVAATKETNTGQIMVYLPGKFPLADGKVEATAEQSQKQSQDAQGNTVNSDILISNTVPAYWKPMGDSNRITPPDVREGTEVSIYQVKGQKKYYWTTWGVNAKTMRLETVIYGWSASPETDENITEEEEDFNIDNFYTLMISTHTGKATFRTSQKNGEKTIFELMVDAMAGRIMIGGKEKNFFVLDDVAHSLMYKNVEGSVLMVDKKEITAYAPDKINLSAENEINLLTKALRFQTTTWQVKAEQTQFDISKNFVMNCPNTAWTGDINLVGDIEQTGGINSSGLIHSNEDVTSKVSLNTHLTTGVKSGGDQSGGPV